MDGVEQEDSLELAGHVYHRLGWRIPGYRLATLATHLSNKVDRMGLWRIKGARYGAHLGGVGFDFHINGHRSHPTG